MNEFQRKVSDFYKNSKRSKRIVCEFFLKHADEIAFMTLDQIAARTGVSPATITRTASEIGFKGYPGLQEEVQKSIKRNLAPVERLEKTNLPQGSLGYRESIAIDQRNLCQLLALNNNQTIEDAITMLSNAPKVCLTASRSSYSTISFLGFMLAQIRPNVQVLTEDEGRIPEQILDLNKDDLLFAVALPRYAKIVIETIKQARQKGCSIISVSDGPTSPLSLILDISLFVPYESYSFFNSIVSTLALFNALVTGVNNYLGEKARIRLEAHNELIEQWNLLVSFNSRKG